MDAWDRSSKNLDTARGVDDMRGLLASSVIKTAAAGGSVVNKIIELEKEGNRGEGPDGSRPSALRSASAPSASDLRRSSSHEHGSGSLAPKAEASAMEVTPSRDSGKLSLSDRLANLNWKFSSTASTPSVEPDASAEPLSTQIGSSSAPALNASTSSPLEGDDMPTPKSVSTVHATDPAVTAEGTVSSLLLESMLSRFRADVPPKLLTLSSNQAASAASASERPLPASLRSPYPPLAFPPTQSRPLHVVLATSGSVASIKLPLMVKRLLSYQNVRVQVIPTKSSLHFFGKEEIATLSRRAAEKQDVRFVAGEEEPYTLTSLAAENAAASAGDSQAPSSAPLAHLWTDEDEWTSWRKVGDPILHIELRRWADIVLVAPCSANTLAKIAGGICDNLLVSSAEIITRSLACSLAQSLCLLLDIAFVVSDLLPARPLLLHAHPPLPSDEYAHVCAPAHGAPSRRRREHHRLPGTRSH